MLENFDEIKKGVVQDILVPSMIEEIKNGLEDRGKWDKSSTVIYTLSIVMGTLAGIFAFAATSKISVNSSSELTFASGCCSFISTALIVASKYCDARSKESTKKVNTVLSSIGINTKIPEIPTEIIESNSKQRVWKQSPNFQSSMMEHKNVV